MNRFPKYMIRASQHQCANMTHEFFKDALQPKDWLPRSVPTAKVFSCQVYVFHLAMWFGFWQYLKWCNCIRIYTLRSSAWSIFRPAISTKSIRTSWPAIGLGRMNSYGIRCSNVLIMEHHSADDLRGAPYGSPPACNTGKTDFFPFPFPFAACAMANPWLLVLAPLLGNPAPRTTYMRYMGQNWLKL